MKKLFLFLTTTLVLAFAGCVSSPVAFKNASMAGVEGQILANISFSGSAAPNETKAHLFATDKNGETVYDKDFWIFSTDFRSYGSAMIVEKYLNAAKNSQIGYSKLTLFLVNETIVREFGKRADASTFFIDAIVHETQYAIILRMKDAAQGSVAQDSDLDIVISDGYDTLYSEKRKLIANEFKNGEAIMLVSYAKVKKSFLNNGTLTVTVHTKAKSLAKSTAVALKQYNAAEKREIQEKEFEANANEIGKNTSYVGFDFLVKKGGIVHLFENGDFKAFARFDVRLKNLRNMPQYLIRDDFYMRDAKISFYPVFSSKSTQFGPLLKAFGEVNASFYFLLFNNTNGTHSFYYGDKKLAEIIG